MKINRENHYYICILLVSAVTPASNLIVVTASEVIQFRGIGYKLGEGGASGDDEEAWVRGGVI